MGGAATGPFRRIRELMNTPFARPPGRRGGLQRFAPELLAAATYGLMLVLAWTSAYARHGRPPVMVDALWLAEWGDACAGAAPAYILVAAIIVLAPMAVAVSSWSAERGRGTMESLVLTPVDRRRLTWGRFLHVVWPWVRYMLWMLPLYLTLAGNRVIREICHSSREVLLLVTYCIGGSKTFFAALLAAGLRRSHEPEALCFLIVLLRWGRDLLGVATTTAMAGHLSMRSRGPRGGLLVTWLVMLAALIFPLSLHDWLVLGLALVERSGVVSMGGKTAGLICFPVWLAVLTAEVAVAWWCLRSLARDFDRYALREGAPG